MPRNNVYEIGICNGDVYASDRDFIVFFFVLLIASFPRWKNEIGKSCQQVII